LVYLSNTKGKLWLTKPTGNASSEKRQRQGETVGSIEANNRVCSHRSTASQLEIWLKIKN